MNKAKVMTVAGTVVASLGVASQVNADDMALSSPAQSSEPQVNQTKTNVTQAGVDTAQANLNTANQAVNNQEQTVKDAATAADNAQSAYDQAQQSTSEAQNLVDQATPENIASAQADVNTAQNQVSQADNAEKVAENTAAQAQEVANNQTAVVVSAQADVNTAQATVDAAQKDVNDKQAILDGTGQAEIIANRDKAQAAVNRAQNQVAQAEDALTKAKEADASRQEAIDKAQKAVDAANQTVTSTKADLDAKIAQANQTQATEEAKQAEVADIQKDVNDKQAILDGTGSQAILNEQVVAEADDAAKIEAFNQAQAELTKAQEADNARDDAIHQAQEASGIAQIEVSNQKDNLDAKQAVAQSATQALDKAKADYTTAENAYNSINTITLSQAYIDALKKYSQYGFSETEYSTFKAILKTESEKLYQRNNYKSNPNDDSTTKYNINNLPETVKQEISLFASDLINQIRKSFGTPETVVTPSSIKFADLVTAGYVADHWSVLKAQAAGGVGHDAKAVNKAADYFGLETSSKTEEEQGWQYYEDWSGSSSYATNQSLSELKSNVFESLKQFMFNGYEWLHASSIASTRLVPRDGAKTYIAVEPSSPGTLNGFHFLLVDSSDVEKATQKNFDTTPIANPYSSDKIIAAYNTAKAALAPAQSAANTATQELAAAQSAYDTAVTNFNKAQDSLAQAIARPILTPAAKTNLANSQTALTKAQERLAKANEAVANLNADIKEKQAALADAKATLNVVKAELATVQETNRLAQAAKQRAQVAYDNAVSNLSDARTTLTTAQAVAIQTPTAKANLASAQATLKQAQDNLISAQKAVDDLTADIKVKQANLASAKQVLATKQATLVAKQTTLATEQNRLVALKNSLVTAQDNVLTAKAMVLAAKDNLTKAQAYLANLQNAPALLAAAQEQEATAKANLLAALDTLEAALVKLQNLQVKQAAAQTVYDTTSKAYQAFLDVQEKQRLQDDYNAIVAQGKTPVAIVDETGKIVGYHIEVPQTVVAHPRTAQAVSKSSKVTETPTVLKTATTPKSSALPITGDSTSLLAIVAGGFLTLFGLIGVRKHKEN